MVIGSGDVFLPATRYQPEAWHPESDHKADSEVSPLGTLQKSCRRIDADQVVLRKTKSCPTADLSQRWCTVREIVYEKSVQPDSAN